MAYRIADRCFHPVPASDPAQHHAQVTDLFTLTTPFVSEGAYSFGGQVFQLDHPGTYRFFDPARRGRQVMILPEDLRGIAACCSDTVGLGNLDREKPHAVIARTLLNRRIITHCKHIAHLSVWMARQAGMEGRVWLMWNDAAVAKGDVLSSHAITELIAPKTATSEGETRLFDLSFGVEMLVNGEGTDFISYRRALIEGTGTQIQSVCADFGYGHSSRFYEGAAGDFKDDYLHADPNALRDAHYRLVIGDQIQGSDGLNQDFIPKSMLDQTGEARERALRSLDAAARDKVIALDDGDIAVPAYAPSKAVLSDHWAGHVLSDATQLTTAQDGGEDSPSLEDFLDLRVVLLTQDTLRLDVETAIALPPDSCVRINRMPTYQPIQIFRYAKSPARFVSSLLEAFSNGDQHNHFGIGDTHVVARARKIVAQGDARLTTVVTILKKFGLPYRVWWIPTRAIGRTELPVEARMTLLEIGDGETGVEVIDTDRRCRFLVEGRAAGFAELEAAAAARTAEISAEPVCRSVGIAYAERHSETGHSLDFMDPIWYSTDLVWRDTLGRIPAIGKQSNDATLTTTHSQRLAAAMRASAPAALRPYIETTLAMKTVLPPPS